jgi:hypothetical protein
MTEELHRAVGGVEGKLDSLICRHDARDAREAAIETRMRKVEHRQHWWSGGAAVLGTIAGAFGVHLRGG